jgi:hypothetical protein
VRPPGWQVWGPMYWDRSCGGGGECALLNCEHRASVRRSSTVCRAVERASLSRPCFRKITPAAEPAPSGHKAGVAGVYNRATYEREVTAALALWADHVRSIAEGGERKIVPLKKPA